MTLKLLCTLHCVVRTCLFTVTLNDLYVPDSIDTSRVMRHLRDIVSACNVYMDDNAPPNTHLLETMALYVTKMLRIFGTLPSTATVGFPVESQTTDVEANVTAIASLVADFREEVRQISLQDKCIPYCRIYSNEIPYSPQAIDSM